MVRVIQRRALGDVLTNPIVIAVDAVSPDIALLGDEPSSLRTNMRRTYNEHTYTYTIRTRLLSLFLTLFLSVYLGRALSPSRRPPSVTSRNRVSRRRNATPVRHAADECTRGACTPSRLLNCGRCESYNEIEGHCEAFLPFRFARARAPPRLAALSQYESYSAERVRRRGEERRGRQVCLCVIECTSNIAITLHDRCRRRHDRCRRQSSRDAHRRSWAWRASRRP